MATFEPQIGNAGAQPGSGSGTPGETTGRLLILTEPIPDGKGKGKGSTAARKAVTDLFSNTIGVQLTSSEEFTGESPLAMLQAVEGSTGVFMEDLGVAVVESHEQWHGSLAASASDPSTPISVVEAERVVWAFNEFMLGYQAGVNGLAEAMLSRSSTGPADPGTASLIGGPFGDDAAFSWGLRAVGAPTARHTGRGSRVAVLDTGIDATHPDLVAAIAATRSFIAGEAVDDRNGHGTHCCGTVAGRANPATVGRYGVAPDAKLYIGKVLSNAGRGSDAGILAGIQWAIQNGCHVISMSLGADVSAGTPHSTVFETVARRALAAGSIIVAAAGNASNRPAAVAPVGHPANCPSILAVGALDSAMNVARFSSAGRTGEATVNISGPGVNVLSAKAGGGHTRLSGTSMATPHVAGVAAVVREATQASGPELALRLLLAAQGLAASAVDVGTGICRVGR